MQNEKHEKTQKMNSYELGIIIGSLVVQIGIVATGCLVAHVIIWAAKKYSDKYKDHGIKKW